MDPKYSSETLSLFEEVDALSRRCGKGAVRPAIAAPVPLNPSLPERPSAAGRAADALAAASERCNGMSDKVRSLLEEREALEAELCDVAVEAERFRARATAECRRADSAWEAARSAQAEAAALASELSKQTERADAEAAGRAGAERLASALEQRAAAAEAEAARWRKTWEGVAAQARPGGRGAGAGRGWGGGRGGRDGTRTRSRTPDPDPVRGGPGGSFTPERSPAISVGSNGRPWFGDEAGGSPGSLFEDPGPVAPAAAAAQLLPPLPVTPPEADEFRVDDPSAVQALVSAAASSLSMMLGGAAPRRR